MTDELIERRGAPEGNQNTRYRRQPRRCEVHLVPTG